MSPINRAESLVVDMERDVFDVRRWGSIVRDIAIALEVDGDDEAAGGLTVVGRSLETLGTSLEGQWKAAWDALRGPGTDAQAGAAAALQPAPKSIADRLGDVKAQLQLMESIMERLHRALAEGDAHVIRAMIERGTIEADFCGSLARTLRADIEGGCDGAADRTS